MSTDMFEGWVLALLATAVIAVGILIIVVIIFGVKHLSQRKRLASDAISAQNGTTQAVLSTIPEEEEDAMVTAPTGQQQPAANGQGAAVGAPGIRPRNPYVVSLEGRMGVVEAAVARQEQEQKPKNPMLAVYQKMVDQIAERGEIIGMRWSMNFFVLDQQSMQLQNQEDAKLIRLNNSKLVKGALTGEELQELQGYERLVTTVPPAETRRPAEAPATPTIEVVAVEEIEAVDEADAVLAEARRIAGEEDEEDA